MKVSQIGMNINSQIGSTKRGANSYMSNDTHNSLIFSAKVPQTAGEKFLEGFHDGGSFHEVIEMGGDTPESDKFGRVFVGLATSGVSEVITLGMKTFSGLKNMLF